MSFSSLGTERNNSEFQDKEVQTVVKVFPFVLPPAISRASVTSDKKFCTVLSLEASSDSSKFYSLLQYCPYHDIEENSIRVINLARKTKLQWVTSNPFSEQALIKTSLADDDGIADICNDLLIRLRTDKKLVYMEAETQTELMAKAERAFHCRLLEIYNKTWVQHFISKFNVKKKKKENRERRAKPITVGLKVVRSKRRYKKLRKVKELSHKKYLSLGFVAKKRWIILNNIVFALFHSYLQTRVLKVCSISSNTSVFVSSASMKN